MARGYRAILELPEKEDAHKIAYRLFSKWFENKYFIPAGRLEAGFEEDGIYRFGKLKVKKDELRKLRKLRLLDYESPVKIDIIIVSYWNLYTPQMETVVGVRACMR